MRKIFNHACARLLVASVVAAGSLAAVPPPVIAASKVARCSDCGTVITTNRKDVKGSGTTGAVVGGIGGAVAGKALGDSTTAAVLGGVGGALAGNMVGKKMTNKKIWSVQVKMDNGQVRNFDYDTDPEFSARTRIRVRDGRLERL